ncbi:nitroreductase family protein [Paratractidigestivibacter sp.]|uniref:nitroreductase family protein n=1 Tax=Paratractidigestivibacter sp. TaxID=2847316 RepID=UPI002AC9EF2A|nr:nitroreductase family protein [Paratractidigestivibacter sp.]
MSDFLSLAQSRYSCRMLSDKPIEPEKIEQILAAAICAPTAVNKQPWHAWVVTDADAVARVNETTRFGFGAQVFIVVGAAADAAWVRKFDGRNFADVDASIVATQIMLEVQDLGLGTTWVGHFDAPALKEMFPQMADYDLIAIFPIGYPADDAQPAPMHATRKPLADLIDRI